MKKNHRIKKNRKIDKLKKKKKDILRSYLTWSGMQIEWLELLPSHWTRR
jgi:hypothetical protein